MIKTCPFNKEELKQILETIYGNNQHKVTYLEIDDKNHLAKWKFDNQTWTQAQSFNVLNVAKLTGQNPLTLFKKEYDKAHPNQIGLSMPNIPAMLEKWAIEFNKKHQ